MGESRFYWAGPSAREVFVIDATKPTKRVETWADGPGSWPVLPRMPEGVRIVSVK